MLGGSFGTFREKTPRAAEYQGTLSAQHQIIVETMMSFPTKPLFVGTTLRWEQQVQHMAYDVKI